MKRTITGREKALLLILLLVLSLAVLVNLVIKPISERRAAARARLEQVQDKILEEQARANKLKTMNEALDSWSVSPDHPGSQVPYYNNVEAVLVQLNDIFRDVPEFNLTFSDLVEGELLVSRPINVIFHAENYTRAREVLNRFDDCPYRCSLSNITVKADNPKDGQADIMQEPVTVTLTVTFYEQNKEEAPQ